MAGIARYYDASKNPSGGAYSGVPLGDISEETWADLPKHLQNSVDACGFYRKSPLPKDAPAAEVKDDKPAPVAAKAKD